MKVSILNQANLGIGVVICRYAIVQSMTKYIYVYKYNYVNRASESCLNVNWACYESDINLYIQFLYVYIYIGVEEMQSVLT